MEDFERYGDDNEIDDAPAGKGKRLLPRILSAVLILALAVFIGRVLLTDYYPKNVKNLYYSPTVSEALDAGAKVYTQKIRFPYDDNDLDTLNSNDLGSFSTAYLYVCPDAGELQVTVKMNKATLEKISERYGIPLDECDYGNFRFSLTDDNGTSYDLSYSENAAFLMYYYSKLCFDGIPLSGEDKPAWIRLVITYGEQDTPYSYALVYENGEKARPFKEYKRS